MYCPSPAMSFCSPYPSSVNGCAAYPPYPPPSSHGSSGCCGVSKLANFVHYGGRCGNTETVQQRDCVPACPQPQCVQKPAKCPPAPRRCPPLPACVATCITPSCKDMPAQRLRNVDVLEELCYYVPGSDPNTAMDCYTVDCCGNVEKITEGDACGCCQDSGAPNPVKYSRRQRFTFNDNDGRSNTDPWPFDGSCGGGGSGGGVSYGKRAGNNCNGGQGDGGPKNPCCGGRQYTYCPEEPIDCSDMLPPESGVYYFDRDRRAFVPEKELPKPPEVIEREVKVPDVEEYEFLEEESPCPPPEKPTIQPVVQPIIMPGGGCPPPCNPCPPQYNPCNPCPPQCNPCAPQCNPCGNSCAPCCNPCNSNCNPCCNPCNTNCNPCCSPCKPNCNPCCNPCNPCMPCGPMNPFMNMCGGVMPMVIPMCPQQPAPSYGAPLPPPPPFPFPPPFLGKKKKKKSRKTSYYDDDTSYSENIIVPGVPENAFDDMDEIPPDAQGYDVPDTIEVEAEEYDLPPLDEETGRYNPGNEGYAEAEGGYGRAEGGGYGGNGGVPNGGGYGGVPNGGGGNGGMPNGGGGYGGAPNGYGGNGRQPNGVGGYGGMHGGGYGVIQNAGGPNGRPGGGLNVGNGRSGGDIKKGNGRPDDGRSVVKGSRRNFGDGGVGGNDEDDDGTLVTTIDFPPGQAEDISITATDRKNANARVSNIDIVAEFKGTKGKGGPYPSGQRLAPTNQFDKNGKAVKSYKIPGGKDGFIRATNY